MAEVAVSVLDVEEKDALNVFYNIETAKIDYFHIDVMDGEFVQNENVLKMRDYALKLQSISMTPLDVHLMVKRPMEHIDYFIDSGADRITFHIEACENSEKVTEIIKYLKDNGIKVGIAINPETRAKDVYEYLPYIHMALVMSVVPGQGGQKFIETSIEKIKNIKKYCKENDIVVEAWSPLGSGRVLSDEKLIGIAEHYSKSVAQLCVRFALQNGIVPLPKSVTEERILENRDVMDFEITKEDMAEIIKMGEFGGSGLQPDEIDF